MTNIILPTQDAEEGNVHASFSVINHCGKLWKKYKPKSEGSGYREKDDKNAAFCWPFCRGDTEAMQPGREQFIALSRLRVEYSSERPISSSPMSAK